MTTTTATTLGLRLIFALRFRQQTVDFLLAQVQSLGLLINDAPLFCGYHTIAHHEQHLCLQRLPFDPQLVTERRRQQRRRDREDTDAQQGQYDRHRAPGRRHRRDVPIAHAGQRNNRPIDGCWNIFELVRLRLVLEQIAQAGRQHHQ